MLSRSVLGSCCVSALVTAPSQYAEPTVTLHEPFANAHTGVIAHRVGGGNHAVIVNSARSRSRGAGTAAHQKNAVPGLDDSTAVRGDDGTGCGWHLQGDGHGLPSG